MTGRFERLHLDEGRRQPPLIRTMPDGSPCWCVSTSVPHVGWIHAPRCLELRAGDQLRNAGRLDPRVPSPDPLRPLATDRDDEDPSGMTCVIVFIGCMVVLALCLGIVIGRITA